jgi:hypothetical protein
VDKLLETYGFSDISSHIPPLPVDNPEIIVENFTCSVETGFFYTGFIS